MSTSFALSRRERKPKAYVARYAWPHDQGAPLRVVAGHHFNRQAEIFVPTAIYDTRLRYLPWFDGTECAKSTYYHTVTPPSSFLRPEFFNEYIKKQNCLVLSLTGIDSEDVFCICEGMLQMSLRKEIYQQSGLQGTQSAYSNSRFNVTYDLRKPSMLSGSSAFNRLFSALTALTEATPFLVCVFPTEGKSPPPPLPAFFNATLYEQSLDLSRASNVLVPPLDPYVSVPKLNKPIGENERKKFTAEVVSEGYMHLLEWISLLAVGSPRVTMRDKTRALISSYAVFDDSDLEFLPPSKKNGINIVKLTISGFLTSQMLTEMYNSVIDILHSDDWAIMAVYGFEDAPVSWGAEEHGFLVSGENDYMLVMRSKPAAVANENDSSNGTSKDVTVFEVVGSHDQHS
ncbi:ribonuclease P 40kDa subunit-domain-containing protein [Limtongia smithiae]|uniref:ribonuclease P 40kDa subunit-domain-containing protein n=1 Tax=Limtongia smithiae TaxID=1125753 RepID=UPI0034CFDF44